MLLSAFILITFSTTWFVVPVVPFDTRGSSLMCLKCDTTDLHNCNTYHKCHGEEVCAMDVMRIGSTNVYSLGCKQPRECGYGGAQIIGRRAIHQITCSECCSAGVGCNKKLCSHILTDNTGQYLTTQQLHSSNRPPTLPPASTTLLACLRCHDIDDPQTCTQYYTCASNQACATVVTVNLNLKLKFGMSCMTYDHCLNLEQIAGPDKHLRCIECCHNQPYCNKNICARYQPSYIKTTEVHMSSTIMNLTTNVKTSSTSTMSTLKTATSTTSKITTNPATTTYRPTTTKTNPTATTITLPSTAAHLTTFSCKPSTTSTKPIATKSATITPKTSAATTAVVNLGCVDHEEDGFSCATYDTWNICTATSGLGYTLARDKCPKHCGLCSSQGILIPTRTSVPEATITPPFLIPTKHHTYLSSTTTPQLTTSDLPCVDFEDGRIKCSDYDAIGFCKDPFSAAYTIAHNICRKHCGFCTA